MYYICHLVLFLLIHKLFAGYLYVVACILQIYSYRLFFKILIVNCISVHYLFDSQYFIVVLWFQCSFNNVFCLSNLNRTFLFLTLQHIFLLHFDRGFQWIYLVLTLLGYLSLSSQGLNLLCPRLLRFLLYVSGSVAFNVIVCLKCNP